MLELLMNNWMEIAKGTLMVLGGFSILAKITPTKADDAIVDKMLAAVHMLGLTKK